MLTQEKFDEIELEHGCGYWNLCCEHACPCAITTENKGLQEKIYNDFIEENKEISNQYNEEFGDELDEYRCSICGRYSELCDCRDYEDEYDEDYDNYDYDGFSYCENCGNADEHEFIDLGDNLYLMNN